MSSTNQRLPHERLKLFRQRTGKSQAEIAGMMHLSLRGYQNYERGDREIPVVTLERARDHFGLNPDWVLDGVGEMYVTGTAAAAEAARIHKAVLGAAPAAETDLDLLREVIGAAAKLFKVRDSAKFTELCVLAYELERASPTHDPKGRVSQLFKLSS